MNNNTTTAAAEPKKTRRLTKAERAEVRSLVEDGDYTEKEARAWVLSFGAGDCAESTKVTDDDRASVEPFCACGNRISRCDGSRAGCRLGTGDR